MTTIQKMIKTNEKTANSIKVKENIQTRKKLLRLAIICAVNEDNQKIQAVSKQLGTIKNEDYIYIDELISKTRHNGKSEEINQFLTDNLNGFKQAHDTYYYALYNM